MALLNEINVKGVSHPIVTDDGYYQEMTVGDAEQLVATTFTEDDAPYNFRTAGGAIDIGDRKQVEGIVGGTICWNQIVRNGNFADTSGWQISSGVGTPTVENGVITFTQKSPYSMAGLGQSKTNAVNRIKPGNIYLFSCDAMAHNEDIRIGIGLPYNNKEKVCPSGVFTKLYSIISAPAQAASDSNYQVLQVGNHDANNVEYTISVKNFNCFDLTQMFGSTIADYIYSLETANAGAGVAWFKKYFPKPYYAYNAGQLMSVKALRHITRGFNAWDEEWEVGQYDQYGQKQNSPYYIRSKNYIPVLPNTSYYFYCGATRTANFNVCFYDKSKKFVKQVWGHVKNHVLTSPDNAYYMTFNMLNEYGLVYQNDICINLSWDGERDGEYEEYVEHVYELDPDLELRGIPKLTAGNDLYYDGDVYEPDGTVTRKYGVVDLGTLNWSYQDSDSNNKYFWTESVTNGILRLGTRTYVCGKYESVAPVVTANLIDKQITRTVNPECKFFIKDSAYSDAASFKTAMSGVYLIYELATPTTEEAEPYNGTQIVDDFGTEEFVDAGVAAETRDVAIPVGHNSLYQPNLRAKLEMVPEAPEDEGYYVVYHHDGINEYVPLIIPQELPNLPSEDGTYTLKCTVASGSATLSFESEV